MRIHRDRRVTPQCAKRRPPLRGRLEKSAGCVGLFGRATSPAGTFLLAGALLQAITTVAGIGFEP